MLNIFKNFWIEFCETMEMMEKHGFIFPILGLSWPIIFDPELLDRYLDERTQNEDPQ